ncbi:MAG: 3'-5' exonuclease [Marmoricola sp.]
MPLVRHIMACSPGAGERSTGHSGPDGSLEIWTPLWRCLTWPPGSSRNEITPGAQLLEMLAEQQIPSDSMVQRVEAATGVAVLTAHRAKGLQWRLVVVAHVQQDECPDLRRRGALLTDVLSSVLGSEPTPGGVAARGASTLLRRLHLAPANAS